MDHGPLAVGETLPAIRYLASSGTVPLKMVRGRLNIFSYDFMQPAINCFSCTAPLRVREAALVVHGRRLDSHGGKRGQETIGGVRGWISEGGESWGVCKLLCSIAYPVVARVPFPSSACPGCTVLVHRGVRLFPVQRSRVRPWRRR